MKPVGVLQLGLPPQIDPSWDQAIQAVAGGDPDLDALIRGTIAQESEWQQDAHNKSGTEDSYGLMQLNLQGGAGTGLSIDQALDPLTNIQVGGAYLSSLQTRFQDDADAASAYNHGAPWRRPGGGYYNQAYVDAVLANRDWYAARMPGMAIPGTTITAPADVTSAGLDPAILLLGLLVGASMMGGRK